MFRDPKYAEYVKASRPTKFGYDQIVQLNSKTNVAAVQQKREQELGQEVLIAEYMQCVRKCTMITKFRSFQYRLLMRSIVTNSHLYRWGKRETNLCSFCEESKESLPHLFVLCKYVTPVWEGGRKMCVVAGYEISDFSVSNVLLNSICDDPGGAPNFMCVIVKQYVYAQRCLKKSISWYEAQRAINRYKQIERYYAVKQGKITKHMRR